MFDIESKEGKQRYQMEMDRLMSSLEINFASEVTPLLITQFERAAEYIRHGNMDTDGAVNVNLHPMSTCFYNQYIKIGTVFGNETLKRFEESTRKKDTTMQMSYWNSISTWARKQAAQKVVEVGKTTKKTISGILEKGMKEGKSNYDMAKDISKIGEISSKYRGKVIARTETHTAAVNAVQVATESTDVEFKREWVSVNDTRTRDMHKKANGERVGMKEPFKRTGESLMYPGDPKGKPGNVIHCLTSYKTPIYTSKGWKWVKDIKVGDLVLTHKNRFRKVIRLNHSLYVGEVITIRFNKGRGYLTVTPEHPFLISTIGSTLLRWKKAKNIREGDFVQLMATYCQFCGKSIPYYQKYCNISCSSKKFTEKQWANPEHRKNISAKTSTQLTREYKNGVRDASTIIEKARKACFKKYGKGGYFGHVIKTRKYIQFKQNRIDKINKKYGSVYNMLVKTAFPALGKVNHGDSKLEKAMATFLSKKGKRFEAQFKVNRRQIDFYVKKEKLFIEVDGYPFHQDKAYERKRDLEILTKYPDHKIAHVCYKQTPPKWEYYDLVSLNHTKTFSQIPVCVKSVSTAQLKTRIKVYNFAVEEDESYIAKGFVTHNCRCVVMYHRIEEGTFPLRSNPEEDNILVEEPKPTNKPKPVMVISDPDKGVERLKSLHLGDVVFTGEPTVKDKLKTINVINTSLTNCYTRFPKIEKILSETPLKRTVLLNDKGIGSNRMTGVYTTTNERIILATKRPINKELLFGKYTVGDDLSTSYMHEIGHHVFEQFNKSTIVTEWETLFKTNMNEFFNVSIYARTNMDEAFAESFSAYTHSLYGKEGKVLPKKIHDFMEKHFGAGAATKPISKPLRGRRPVTKPRPDRG
jgi:hypothetical protein